MTQATKGKRRSLSEMLWIGRIFKAEFAFSDVRSNYSRVYAWMANQLGHLALGLGAGLLFYWVVSTTESLLDAWPVHRSAILVGVVVFMVIVLGILILLLLKDDDEGTKLDRARVWLNEKQTRETLVLALIAVVFVVWPELKDRVTLPILSQVFCADIKQGCSATLNASLLGFTAVTVVLAIARLLYFGLIPQAADRIEADVRAERADHYAPMTVRVRQTLTLLALLPLATASLLALRAGFVETKTQLGIGVAATCFALLVAVVLAKDWRFGLLGVLAVIGASLLATDLTQVATSFGATNGTATLISTNVGFYGAVLFTVIGIYLLVLRAPPKYRMPYDRWFYALVVVIPAYWFARALGRSVNGLECDWRIPISAAVASMAIWAVKEFGNDLPNVHCELLAARKQRGDLCPTDACDHGDALDRTYFESAIWDTRTDALFCLSGAWIAAGVLSQGAVIYGGAGAWSVGSELIGLTLFGMVFYFGGRNWAYRQQAQDLTGAERGNMLAVLDSSISLVANGSSKHEQEPRELLYHFARGTDEGRDIQFDHIVVFGSGRFNARLANALVTEAALADLSPRLFGRLKPHRVRRLARTLSYGHLLDYDPENLEIAYLPYNALEFLYYKHPAATDPGGPANEALRRVTIDASKNYGLAFRPANLIAVARCRKGELAKAVTRLGDPGLGQKTAWFFDDQYFEDQQGKSDPVNKDCAIRALQTALGSRIGKGLAVIAQQSSPPT